MMKAFGGDNPFKSLTKEEKENLSKVEQERLILMKDITEKARICLKLEEFSDYTARYKKGEDTLIQAMLNLDIDDPMQEWKQFKELQVKIKMLRSLMVDVIKDGK